MQRGRTALYARLSRDIGGTGAGVDRQLQDARQLAAARDLEVVAEYTDNDLSAAGNRRRPGFERLIAEVENGQLDVVVAWAWDRLSRNRHDTLRLIEAGQNARLTVALVRGSDIDMSSASGRLVADLLAGVARAEIDTKSERQLRASRQRAEEGASPARRAFGYSDGGTPHPVDAPVVAETYAAFLAGATMTGLAADLNRRGITTARGNAWSDNGVRVMLTNPRYVAERWYRGERVAAGTWPPLIAAETFAAVQSTLKDPGRKKRRPARRYLGTGLYSCHCGDRVTTSYAVNGARTYVCRARRHMQRLAEPVDDLVERVVAERLRKTDIAALVADDTHTADAANLRQEALGLRERLDGLAVDYAAGMLTGRQVQVATAGIETRLANIETALAEAGRISAVATVAGAADAGTAWLALPLDRKRAVLDALIAVTILPGRTGRPRRGYEFDVESVRIEWRTS